MNRRVFLKSAAALAAGRRDAETIALNARVATLDPRQPWAEALTLRACA